LKIIRSEKTKYSKKVLIKILSGRKYKFFDCGLLVHIAHNNSCLMLVFHSGFFFLFFLMYWTFFYILLARQLLPKYNPKLTDHFCPTLIPLELHNTLLHSCNCTKYKIINALDSKGSRSQNNIPNQKKIKRKNSHKNETKIETCSCYVRRPSILQGYCIFRP